MICKYKNCVVSIESMVSYQTIPRQMAWIRELEYNPFNYSTVKAILASYPEYNIHHLPIPDYSGKYHIPSSIVDMIGHSFCSPVESLTEVYDNDNSEFCDLFRRIPEFGKYVREGIQDHAKLHSFPDINLPYYISILSLGVSTSGSTFVNRENGIRIVVGASMNLYMFRHAKLGTTVVADLGNVRILVKEGQGKDTFHLIVKKDFLSLSVEICGPCTRVEMEGNGTYSAFTAETNSDETVSIIYSVWKTRYMYARAFEWFKNGEYKVAVLEKFGVLSVYHTDLRSKKERSISRAQPRQVGNGSSTSSSGGARGRSLTYLHERTGSTTHLKQVFSDDELVYEEKENILLQDKLDTNSRSRLFSTIGWKLARNSNGEHRILKLRIPETAHIITAVDRDFVASHQKKRCNKCLVEDIQLPLRGEECSVVPEERSAVSCVYDGRVKCVYRVGEEVVPSSFCEDVSKGCAPGIHFFTERDAVFEMYQA